MEPTPVNIPAEPGVPRRDGFRCVLLVRGGVDAAPPDLLLSLSRRAVEVVSCSTPFEAMARLLRLRAAGGDRPTALLIVEPAGFARAEELVRSVERFAPKVARWRYDDCSEPKLRGFTLPRPEAAANDRPARPGNGVGIPVRTASPPRLRLTGAIEEFEAEGTISPASPSSQPAAQEPRPAPATLDELGPDDGLDPNIRAADLLTEEELAMLLADDGAPARGARRAGAGRGEGGQ